MRGPLRFQAGTCGSTAAGNTVGVFAGKGLMTAPADFRARRRLGIFCRSSHTRSVSAETVTPNLASDCASSLIGAP